MSLLNYKLHFTHSPPTMKKITLLICLIVITIATQASGLGSNSQRIRLGKSASTTVTKSADKSDNLYNTVSTLYSQGKISADSIINLALYHKAAKPAFAESCLKLVADKNPRAVMELGVIYAFSPEYAKYASEGVKLLQRAANAGCDEANAYLGLYYYTHKDYAKAQTCFNACRQLPGFAYAALGGMYINGTGVRQDPVKAREYYHKSSLKGYPRGMALYGFNLRATGGGNIDYPDSFLWLYIAGDLGDDAARTALYLPRVNEDRGTGETAKDANLALQWIAAAQSGKKIQDEPIYKSGFLASLKAREKAAEEGDDWARYYLGSMNYNGDFLNQNYTQALRYYEPIAKNSKLPKPVLAKVHERLGKIYSEGHGTKADKTKAAAHYRAAAQYGSLPSYMIVENISR